MRQLYILITLLLPTLSLSAQTPDHVAINATVQQLFDGMRAGDSSVVRQVFMPNAKMQTVTNRKNGDLWVIQDTLRYFLDAIGTPHEENWDERLINPETRIDGPMATVWAPYEFYEDNKFIHCGVNNITLLKGNDGKWKIHSIVDTRRRNNCKPAEAPATPQPDEQAINKIMDDWHAAAGRADYKAFFDPIANDGIYLGTDGTERWTKAAFSQFAKPYFDKGKAWDFKPHDRVVYFSKDRQTAWFEEKLDTWMDECRGSGVLRRTKDSWELVHYNLAVAVGNDVIQDYLKMLKKKKKKK